MQISVVSGTSEAQNHANNVVSSSSEIPGVNWLQKDPATRNRLLDLGPGVEGPAAVAKPLQFDGVFGFRNTSKNPLNLPNFAKFSKVC